MYEFAFFLCVNNVSLMEYKPDIDYNVVMQAFCHIAFIWEDYEKEQEKKEVRNLQAEMRKKQER